MPCVAVLTQIDEKYEGLLALAGADLIDPEYDPKAGYPPAEIA